MTICRKKTGTTKQKASAAGQGCSGKTSATRKSPTGKSETRKSGTGKSKTKKSPIKKKSKPRAACTTSNIQPAVESNADLMEMVREEVRQRGAAFTRSMMTMAIEGNVNCARLLLSLYEREQLHQPTDAGSARPSVAMTWAGEPEWGEPSSEEAAEALLSDESNTAADGGSSR